MKRKPHGLTGKPNVNRGKQLKPTSSVRSMRFPDSLWQSIDEDATKQNTTPTAVTRTILSNHYSS